MTKEENLHWIDEEIRTWENECQSKHPIKEALYAARKALEQEPCEDAVSRKAVHDMLENLPITVEDKWFNWLQKTCMRLAELPSVTPQEPKFIVKADGTIEQVKDCKNCLFKNERGKIRLDCISRTRAIERLKLNFPSSEGADNSRNRHRHMQALADLQAIKELPSVTPQESKTGYLSINDVMSVFDDFMRGDADEEDAEIFLEMLKDKAESEGV